LSVGYAPGEFLAHLVFARSFPFVIVDPPFFPEDFAQDLNPVALRATGTGAVVASKSSLVERPRRRLMRSDDFASRRESYLR
jgi:hypothetical protein